MSNQGLVLQKNTAAIFNLSSQLAIVFGTFCKSDEVVT